MGEFENMFKAILFSRGIPLTIYVVNNLNEEVVVKVKGNRIESTEFASDIDLFSVPAGKADFLTLIPEQTGLVPYIFTELSCSTAPTSGNVVVYALMFEKEEVIADLEIRDTNVHTPDTDKMSYVRWW